MACHNKGREMYISVKRGVWCDAVKTIWSSYLGAGSIRVVRIQIVFYRTPKDQVDYQTLGRLSWISCLAKSWWYSEKLWSFRTLTVHNHQDRWRNLAPKTSRVSVPVAYSAPPVSKPARNTSWLGPRSQTVQTTCLLKIQLWRINSKKKTEISNKLKQLTPILTSDQTLFGPTVLLNRNLTGCDWRQPTLIHR